MSSFEVLGRAESNGPFVFTCEHASNRVPAYLVANEEDRSLLDLHWGWDIGARAVTAALHERLGGQAILGGYSRLVIDLNRDPKSADLIIADADGQPIGFNTNIDDSEREARLDQIFAPFHEAVDETLATRLTSSDSQPILLSVHSFTPVFRDQRRDLEIGVLFDEHEETAHALHRLIGLQDFHVALNEPYSGRPPNGLIYSAKRHGNSQGVRYVELEIRHDLIDTTDRAEALAARLAPALEALSAH